MSSTTKHFVLILNDIQGELQEQLQQISPDLQIVVRPAQHVEEIPDDLWQKTEILFTTSILPKPEQVPNLRWVQLYSAGINQAFTHPLFQTQAMFTSASGVHASNIAEYVIMMQLAWFHHLPLLLEWSQKGQWAPKAVRQEMFTIQEMRDKTIGIVGYGSIGREVARLAKTFGMRVLALQHSEDHRDHGFIFPGIGDPDGTLPHQYYAPAQLHALLHESDVVVIGVPLTPQTTHMFDEAAFNAMKPTAFLVNIARGEVCDQQALTHALQEKRIAGAALDVLSPEPLPADNPLWKLPNVIISPHISGGTNHYNERVVQIFAENLRRYLARERLFNIVNKEQGY